MGVASDALTNPDFERTRQLPGWPEVAQRIERLTSPAPSPSTSAASTKPANAASGAASAPAPRASASAARANAASTSGAPDAAPAVASAATSAPGIGLAAAEAARFPIRRFSPAGLAYDSVSRRLLVADRVDRKLIVVGDGANHADDLVRSDSAGFQDISAMDVDARRGDLWVASTAASDGSAALHKLQLVSGRPLKAFPVAAELQPVKFVDVATTPSGVVVVLDSIGNRLFVLRPGETTIKAFVPLNANDPTSVATAAEDGVAYVAAQEIGAQGWIVQAIAVAMDVVIAGVFLLFGIFARKRHRWAFIAGMVLYVLDILPIILVQDWFGLAFHGVALWAIFTGMRAMDKQKEH
jgi:hypothetical protein